MVIHTRTYLMGEQHSRWTLKVTDFQSYDSYKYILTDADDDIYIGTNFLTALTSLLVEQTLNDCIDSRHTLETLHDVFLKLQESTNGPLFAEISRIAPRMADGVLLLSID